MASAQGEREMRGGGRGWSDGVAAPPLLWCFDQCAPTTLQMHCDCGASVSGLPMASAMVAAEETWEAAGAA
eukprot:7641524-Pyramimonas_sp.AAC.1